MPSAKYRTPIEAGRVFHVYNRGINHQAVFPNDEDKRWFLRRFKHYLHDYADILCYCILDNHYHFLLRIKENPSLPSTFSRQFGKLILSYTHYFNRKYGHDGPVFHRCFKRLIVNGVVYLKTLFWYIHFNPMKHFHHKDYLRYPFSSYASYKGRDDDLLAFEEGVAVFGSINNLLEFHDYMHEIGILEKLPME